MHSLFFPIGYACLLQAHLMGTGFVKPCASTDAQEDRSISQCEDRTLMGIVTCFLCLVSFNFITEG